MDAEILHSGFDGLSVFKVLGFAQVSSCASSGVTEQGGFTCRLTFS